MGSAAIALVSLALLGAPVRADAPLVGVQVALVQPESDLNGGKWLHGRAGAMAGVHAVFDLEGGHAVCVRADATYYRSGLINLFDGSGSTQLYAQDARARILALGADYNYFFTAEHLEGVYLLLGAGWSWAALTEATQVSGPPVSAWPADQHSSSFQYALGLGWKFMPHLGSEFRFTQSSFRDLGVSGTLVKAPALSLGLTIDY